MLLFIKNFVKLGIIEMNEKIYNNMMKPAFIFDGRNILDGEKLEEIGFKYYGIGK